MDDVDQAAFREAMARFPAGVTIVTTADRAGRPRGFTASSFCSVSLDPPLVLVCLARSAESYPVFDTCDRFAVSMLGEDDADLAHRFATRRPDKFAVDRFRRKGDHVEVEVPLTIPEALRGAEVEVPTLSGRKRLRVAPGTKHGTVQRLRGEGLPRLGGSGRGDIHYRFVLDVPGRLSREQEEAVQRLSEVMNGDPRARLFEGARAGAGERGGS